MDGFTGFKTATTEELPDAVAVMDPFHVVRLAGDALDQCRRRIQQHTWGHRGRKTDPLYSAHRTLHTGADLLTDKQKDRLAGLFELDAHLQVEVTWGIYLDTLAGRTLDTATVGKLDDEAPTTSSLLEDLEGRSWIEGPDGRWRLTQEGRSAVDRLGNQLMRHREVMFRGVDDADYRTTVETLARISSNLDPQGVRTAKFR